MTCTLALLEERTAMTWMLAAQFTGVAILLFGSGFFSGSETALFGLSKMKRRSLERRGEGAAAQVLALLRRPRPLLITILIGNTFVNVALSALGTSLAGELVGDDNAVGVAIFAVTALLLIVGEVLPKVLAVRFGEAFSLRVAPHLERFHRLVSPVTEGIEGVTKALVRRLPGKDLGGDFEEAELVTLLKIGEERGAIGASEADLVEGILALGGTEAREVMTPRVELQALAWDSPPADLREQLRKLRHRLVPLYGEDLDDLKGLLAAREYLLAPGVEAPQDFVREPYLVPEGKKLADLLEDFRNRRISAAMVLDEYGGVSGLVTLEDILEEVFGEVFRPGEIAEAEVRETDKGFRILGKTTLDEVEEVLGLTFEEDEEEDVTTLGGFVMSQLGRLPRRGDRVEYLGWRFDVAHVLRRRVVAIDVVERTEEPSSGEAS